MIYRINTGQRRNYYIVLDIQIFLYFIEGDPEDTWVISKKDKITIEFDLLKNI